MSRLWSNETRVSYISQEHWEELAATLSNTKPEDDSDNEDDGILNSFIATVNLTEGIVKDVDEEEELVESNLRRWINKMTSIQSKRNYTIFLRNMRNFIG